MTDEKKHASASKEEKKFKNKVCPFLGEFEPPRPGPGPGPLKFSCMLCLVVVAASVVTDRTFLPFSIMLSDSYFAFACTRAYIFQICFCFLVNPGVLSSAEKETVVKSCVVDHVSLH